MIRRIAFQYENGTPMELLTTRANSSGAAICDYADINSPLKRIPRIVEYNWDYRYFFLFDEQKVYPCKSEFTPKQFVETVSDVLTAHKCRTARLDYYQVFDSSNELAVTEQVHLGMVDLSGNTSGVKFMGSSEEILSVARDLSRIIFTFL